MFFFKCSGDHQDLHSFPTRRSSDLCYVRALADEAGIERINTRWSDYVHVTDTGITEQDRKSTRLNSSHTVISYAVFCLKTKKHYLKRLLVGVFNRVFELTRTFRNEG